jgi:hypothetical protein
MNQIAWVVPPSRSDMPGETVDALAISPVLADMVQMS